MRISTCLRQSAKMYNVSYRLVSHVIGSQRSLLHYVGIGELGIR